MGYILEEFCGVFESVANEKNLEIKNAMLWDIKRLHKVEFEIGIHALKIIEENLNFELPEDEAASIALHIVNAQRRIVKLSATLSLFFVKCF